MLFSGVKRKESNFCTTSFHSMLLTTYASPIPTLLPVSFWNLDFFSLFDPSIYLMSFLYADNAWSVTMKVTDKWVGMVMLVTNFYSINFNNYRDAISCCNIPITKIQCCYNNSKLLGTSGWNHWRNKPGFCSSRSSRVCVPGQFVLLIIIVTFQRNCWDTYDSFS